MLPFDQALFEFFFGWTGHSRALDWLFIFFAKYLFWVILIWAAWVILAKKDWGNSWPAWKNKAQYFSVGLISLILSRGVVANALDSLMQSPRPFATLGVEALINHASVNSFPSGHMATLIPIVLTLLAVKKRSGLWALIGALGIGLARVVVGVHWPSDILGGIAIGTLSFLLVYLIFRKKKLIS